MATILPLGAGRGTRGSMKLATPPLAASVPHHRDITFEVLRQNGCFAAFGALK